MKCNEGKWYLFLDSVYTIFNMPFYWTLKKNLKIEIVPYLGKCQF